MATLLDISDDLVAISERIREADGEITPEIEARLDAIEGELDQKITRIAMFIEERLGDAEKASAQEQRLRAIRRAFEREADNLKRYLKLCMERAGKLSVVTPEARVSVQRNSQPAIRWTGAPLDIPEGYRRVTIAPDLDAVREDINAGVEPPAGFTVEYDTHLRIF